MDESLIEHVSELQADISELQDTVEYLDNSFDAYKEQIEKMVDKLSNSIYELHKRVDALFDVVESSSRQEKEKSVKYTPYRLAGDMWLDPSKYVK
jgi:predicted nuclease with TOPRIM domain